MLKTYHLLMLSGGKDSVYLYHYLVEQGCSLDGVCYVDLGVDAPGVSQVVFEVRRDAVSRGIEFFHLEPLRGGFEYWAFEHVLTKGAASGSVGYGFCGRVAWGVSLKRDTGLKLINKIKRRASVSSVVEYIGIASDEICRCRVYPGRQVRYPLAVAGIASSQCLERCFALGHTWGGWYSFFSRSGCWCCERKRLSELSVLYHQYPSLWSQLREWDKISRFPFRGVGVGAIELKVKKQLSLFP